MRAVLLVVVLALFCNASPTIGDAKSLYKDHNYTEAFAAFATLAELGSKESALYVARMYEDGLGVRRDPEQSAIWYKIVANRFYEEESLVHKGEFNERRDEIYRSYDPIKGDPLADKTLKKRSRLMFGFNAYKENYFLPFGYADSIYPEYVASDQYREFEAEFQYSFSVDLVADLFGLEEIYGVSMTQHGFWQLYTPSSPFREINYNPEIYILFPLLGSADVIGLKSVTLTISHESNGQGNIESLDINKSNYTEFNQNYFKNRSRSWNYLSAVFGFQFSQVFADLTLWSRVDFAKTDDNPDLIDYIGHGELSLTYITGEHNFKTTGRYNTSTQKGAIKLAWSYPVYERESIYWYVKFFSGYGESLIDYDRYVHKASVGFSFSR